MKGAGDDLEQYTDTESESVDMESPEVSRNYTYIIECRDGRLYTGWTTCIEKRLRAHNNGTGARFTRGRGPVELRYLELSETRSDAMKREAAIKKMSHAQKEQLIQQGDLKKILKKNHIRI